MQIVDHTPESFTPVLKDTLRELLDYTAAHRLKGIRQVVFEMGSEDPGALATTRYMYKDGQATIHVELGVILRQAGGPVPLEWRVWTVGRKAAHALSFALANHALRGARTTPKLIKEEAQRIQLELLKVWSERWIGRARIPSLLKGFLMRLVDRRLLVMAQGIPEKS